MRLTKYGIEVAEEILTANINRLTNQLWKLIPMREHEEDWLEQLNTVIVEIVGLYEVFETNQKLIILLSKLEGLRLTDTEFKLYRKTVFEAISLLREI